MNENTAPAGEMMDVRGLDVCTDGYNCRRCKTHPNHRGSIPHAGIPVGNSFGAQTVDVGQALRASPAAIPILTAEMRSRLNGYLSDHWYGCAQDVWDDVFAGDVFAGDVAMPNPAIMMGGGDFFTADQMREYAQAALASKDAEIATLTEERDVLERLCDATYVAQGADAYNHACNEMEAWQATRRKSGKEIGTEGSLCDGMGWVYSKLDELETERDALKAESIKTESTTARLRMDYGSMAQRLTEMVRMCGGYQDQVVTLVAERDALRKAMTAPPAPENLIKSMFDGIVTGTKAKQFDNFNWFVAGATCAEEWNKTYIDAAMTKEPK